MVDNPIPIPRKKNADVESFEMRKRYSVFT